MKFVVTHPSWIKPGCAPLEGTADQIIRGLLAYADAAEETLAAKDFLVIDGYIFSGFELVAMGEKCPANFSAIA